MSEREKEKRDRDKETGLGVFGNPSGNGRKKGGPRGGRLGVTKNHELIFCGRG